MTQMSRTQPPPTAPPTIINIGSASARTMVTEEMRGKEGEGRWFVKRRGRDEMRDSRT